MWPGTQLQIIIRQDTTMFFKDHSVILKRKFKDRKNWPAYGSL